MSTTRAFRSLRKSVLAILLLTTADIASVTARAAQPSPASRASSPDIRQRVEAFLRVHPEIEVDGRDLDRLVTRLSRSTRGALDGAPESFERQRAAARIPDARIVAALSALGLRSTAPAAEPAAASAERAVPEGGPSGTSGISGSVTDAVTHSALENQFVDVFDANGGLVMTIATAPNGTYQTGGVLAGGTYFAATKSTGSYVGELYDGLPCWPNCEVNDGTPIVLGVGEIETGIDFALTEGGTISGVVENLTANPLQGEVQLLSASGQFFLNTSSDSNGEYEFAPVPAGTYRVRARDFSGYLGELYDDIQCQFDCDFASGDAVVVASGGTSTADFALAPGGTIGGTIIDAETELPLENVRVIVLRPNGNFAAEAFTDSNGDYVTSASLPTGSYHVRTVDFPPYLDELYGGAHCGNDCGQAGGTPVAVTTSQATGNVDFELDQGGAIAGTVTSGKAPLSFVYISVYTADGDYYTDCLAGGDGTYQTTRGLVAGNYKVRTSGAGDYVDELYDDIPCFAGDCDYSSGADVAVTEGETTGGIDFDLVLGGKISGTVTEAGTEQGIENVEIAVFGGDGDFRTSGYTASDGTYTTYGGLPSGTYYLRASSSSGHVDENYDDIPCVFDCDPTLGTGVAVTKGATTSAVDFELEPGGSISGTVTDAATDDPIEFVSLEFYDSAGQFVGDSYTDSEGNYRSFEGYTTGTYYVRTFNREQYLDERYDNQPCLVCDATGGTGVSVTLGLETTGVDFELATGGAIAGEILDAGMTEGGGPQYVVKVFDANGERVEDLVTSGGYQSRRGLPSGNYYVTAFDNSFNATLRGAAYPDLPCPFGDCPMPAGSPVTVTVPSTTNGIDFVLERRAIAADGFESEGFGAWAGGAGIGTACAHSMCVVGQELDPACDPCVATVIAEDAECGDDFWDPFCIEQTYLLCGVPTCEWLPGEED